MKKLILFIACILTSHFLFAQWTTSGSIIYYNSGNVGVWTSAPYAALEVKSPIDLAGTSTQYVGPINLGSVNDFGAGQASQYVLLIPQFNGTTGEADAGLSGILREYRGSTSTYNAVYEYDLVAQTAYSSSFINLLPKSVNADILNIYSVTYGGTSYLAILASDLISGGGTLTFTGHFWNNVNSVKPQVVLASACSNISVFQSSANIAGSNLTANASGYVGIGTPTAQAPLHVVGPGVALNDYQIYTGDMSIQSNTGGRSDTIGAALEFVIPANSDGSNPWGQGRIMTVAGNTSSGSAVGKMVLGTRRFANKFGIGNEWYYGSDIVIDGSGNVGIGTLNPQSLFSVEGTITAKLLNVTQNNWSDFVFDSAYHRQPLADIARYVAEHNHLPEIPSAAQIATSGLDIGNMQKLQMQKIEELTLDAIDADKRAQQQDSLILQQQALLRQMQAQLKAQQGEIELLKRKLGN